MAERRERSSGSRASRMAGKLAWILVILLLFTVLGLLIASFFIKTNVIDDVFLFPALSLASGGSAEVTVKVRTRTSKRESALTYTEINNAAAPLISSSSNATANAQAYAVAQHIIDLPDVYGVSVRVKTVSGTETHSGISTTGAISPFTE